MKKRYKILITLLVIIIALAGVIWWQFGNIRSIYFGLKFSEEDIAEMSGKSFEYVDGYLKDNPKYNVRPSKPVEEKLHKEGIIDDEELTALITEKTTVKEMFGKDLELDGNKEITAAESGEKIDKDTANQLKEENAKNNETKEEGKNSHDEEITNCIARMYVLKSSFETQLEALYNEAFEEYKVWYHKLPPEQRDSKKKEIITNFYPKATALESQCDADVKEVLSKLETLLKKSGEDTSIVTKMKESYDSEKVLKKAYYFSLLT